MRNYVVIMSLLCAAPLSAQQTVVFPDVEITNEHPITNEINVQVMTDSTMLANLNRNLEALRLEIAAQECDTCGGSNVVRAGQGVLVLIAAFMAWQVKKIADKPNGDDVHGDVKVEVNVPKHDHGHDDDNDSES